MKKLLKKGFTLVELVVVVAIIAILSGVSVAVYAGITDRAKQTACDSEADSIGYLITIAALEDSDGFDFVYDVTNNKYIAYDSKTTYDGSTKIHYTCNIIALGAQISFVDDSASGAATLQEFADTAVTKSKIAYETAGDMIKAIYCLHEGLEESEFIGNDLNTEHNTAAGKVNNFSSDNKTITGFTYVADSLKTSAYTFAK